MLIKVNLRGTRRFVRPEETGLECDLPMGDLGLFMLMFIKAWAYISTFGTWLMGEMRPCATAR